MHPIVHERGFARRRLGLGDLGLVMREDQVEAPTVKVVARPEDPGRDRGVLDVPPRSTGTPGALPLGLARGGRFPEDEVLGGLLTLIPLDAGPRLEGLDSLSRELPVGGELRHGKVDRAVVGPVGVAPVHQGLDLGDDLGDVVGRVRVQIDRVDPQPVHQSQELPVVAVG